MASTPAAWADRQSVEVFQLWQNLQGIVPRPLAPENGADTRIAHARELLQRRALPFDAVYPVSYVGNIAVVDPATLRGR